MADKTVFSIAGLSAEMTPPADGKPMDFTGGIASFSGDLSGVTDPQTKAIVDAFGYQTINGSYQTAGTWNLADGRMNITQNDIHRRECRQVRIQVRFQRLHARLHQADAGNAEEDGGAACGRDEFGG